MAPVFIALLQFVLILVCLEAGFRIAMRRKKAGVENADLGLVETAIFGLLGLLLGFAFAGSMSRLDLRRELIVQEANTIGTAWLRIDLLPADSQPEMRDLFHAYLHERLEVYEMADSGADPAAAITEAEAAQRRIWALAVAATSDPSAHPTRMLVLPAINDMIDVTTSRTIALHTSLPWLILVLLISVSLLSAMLAGHTMAKSGRRSLLHMAMFAASVCLTTYAVLDLDNPRSGLIRLDAADGMLRNLQNEI